MHDWQSLSHVRWECKYHVVIVPKYRKKKLYGKFKHQVGEILRSLFQQRGVEMLEGTLKAAHIHMCLSVPPKFSIAFVIGFLKGKSAIRIQRHLSGNKNTKGKHFWSRGYCVSTVGFDEDTICKYIWDPRKCRKAVRVGFRIIHNRKPQWCFPNLCAPSGGHPDASRSAGGESLICKIFSKET